MEEQDQAKSAAALNKRSTANARKVGAFKKGESSQFLWAEEGKVKEALSRLSAGTSTWLMLGNKDASNKNSIDLLSEGKGDIEDIRGLLEDDAISFFVLAKTCPDEDMSTSKEASNYNVVRNIFLAWVGPKVKPMLKARSSQHRAALYMRLKPMIQLHGELQLAEKAELTDDAVYDKLGVTGWRVTA